MYSQKDSLTFYRILFLRIGLQLFRNGLDLGVYGLLSELSITLLMNFMQETSTFYLTSCNMRLFCMVNIPRCTRHRISVVTWCILKRPWDTSESIDSADER